MSGAATPGTGRRPGAAAAFEARRLSFRYPGAGRRAVDGVDLSVESGELFGLIGPNGSGKSTLLRLLLGTLEPSEGTIDFGGTPVSSWAPRELARRVGVVPQTEEVAFPLTVRDFVAMGRYPHLGPWRSEREEDRRAVDRALRRCDLDALGSRSFSTLSGGERQLARVARALAQEPGALVLDEPTVSLDLRHEMEILDLLRRLVDEQGVTVVLVTHHLNAAARTADRLLLLCDGTAVAAGPPGEVLTREAVERAYGWPVAVDAHPGPGPDAGAPRVVPLRRPTDAEEGSAGPGHGPHDGPESTRSEPHN